MARRLSPERQGAYYLGMGLSVIGFLVFISTFFTFVGRFSGGPPGIPFGHPGGPGSFMARPLAGMGLLALGSLLMRLGSRGAAGSGLILDPEQAREDLEPYSRMAGGMLKDALEEADFGVRRDDNDEAETRVMVRCRECRTLNEEDAKFCKECGGEL